MAPVTRLEVTSTEDDYKLLSGKPPCGICRRQYSLYTCPKCNLPYCSLQCFRSDEHSQCSETFYKSEIENVIRSQPSKTVEEKQKMMDILKRFEEDKMDDDDDDAMNEEGEDEDGLAQKLADMDLDTANPEDIWAILTPAQRESFLKTVQNPKSEAAQALLRSEEMTKQKIEPWWEGPTVSSDEQEYSKDSKRWGKKPEMMQIPKAMVKPRKIAAGPPLLYNICGVIFAYAYLTHHLAHSPLSSLPPEEGDAKEAIRVFHKLVPFLTDNKSRVFHSGIPELETALWSRMEEEATSQSFALLFGNAAWLLTTHSITEYSSSTAAMKLKPPPTRPGEFVPDLEVHPSNEALLALSDVASLFRQADFAVKRRMGKLPVEEKTQHETHVTMKLRFYAAYILSLPTEVVSAFARDLRKRAETLQYEEEARQPMSGLIIKNDERKKSQKPVNRAIVEDADEKDTAAEILGATNFRGGRKIVQI